MMKIQSAVCVAAGSLVMALACTARIAGQPSKSGASRQSAQDSPAATQRQDAKMLFEQAQVLQKEGKFAEAVAAYQKVCDGGLAAACTRLADMYDEATGVAKDRSRSAELYRRGCDGGDAAGCTLLGSMYATGLGVAQDQARAAELALKGCDGGDPQGCVLLAQMYADGLGVAKDQARAVEIARRVCDGNSAPGLRPPRAVL